jgi:hypothetical protein
MTSFLDLAELRGTATLRIGYPNLGVVLESLAPAIDPSLARPILAPMPTKVIISVSLKNCSVELTRKE